MANKSRDASARDPPVESEEEEEEAESGEEEEVEEEEGSSSEEETEASESEPEPPRTQSSQVAKKPPSSSAASKKTEPLPSKTQSAAAEDSSSEDEDSDSEGDSDSDSPNKKSPDPNIKPIASKPMDDDALKTPTSANPRRARSKISNTSGPTSPAKIAPAPGAGTKRSLSATLGGATDNEAKDSKRSKKKSETGVESSEEKGASVDDSKKLFQRLWSEDDEIVILQGMIDYRARKKADPMTDLNAFHEFIKKSIHIDVSRTQLQDKIRRLKKKYENNFTKEKKGKEKISSKPHEQMAYELSKKIWGKEGNDVDHDIGSPKANGTAVKKGRTKNAMAQTPKKVDEQDEDAVMKDIILGAEKGVEGFKGVCTSVVNSGIENWIANDGMTVMKGEKREELAQKWKKFNVLEVEVYVKKLELMLEQAKSVLEALKSSEH